MKFLGINLDPVSNRVCMGAAEKLGYEYISTKSPDVPGGPVGILMPLENKELIPFIKEQSKEIISFCLVHNDDYLEGLKAMTEYEEVTTIMGKKSDYEDLYLSELVTYMGNVASLDWHSYELLLSGKTKREDCSLVNESKFRYREITDMVEFIEKHQNNSPVLDHIYSIYDELIMNALFDARGETSPRKCGVSLDKSESVTFRWAVDEQFAILSALDPQGTIKRYDILENLIRCHSPNTEEKINYITVGSGLGVYMISKLATAFIVNVIPGVLTECITTYPYKMRLPNYRKLPRTLHFQHHKENIFDLFKQKLQQFSPGTPVDF